MAQSGVPEYGAFASCGVEYPLTASTDRALIQDVDPALYHASEFVRAMLDRYLGARLNAQSKTEGLNLSAVRRVLVYEPAPELTTDAYEFPLMAIYRKSETIAAHTATRDRIMSEWEIAYLLPHLSERQHATLSPILRAVAQVLRHVLRRGWDPSYKNGEHVWKTAGIEQARVTRVDYTGFERKDEFTAYYRAIVIKLDVWEGEAPIADAFEPYTSGTATIDLQPNLPEEQIPAFVEVEWNPAPVITSVTPSFGPAAGGTVIVIRGSHYEAGSLVTIGDVPATAIVVLDGNRIQCTTPPGNGLADVRVTMPDGRSGVKPIGFAFT